MMDARQQTASADSGIDLTQFYQIFFEEAGENLDSMEKMLLELDLAQADDEELNAIFRCAHSIKGGAATFGFGNVAALTHQMESLLDRLRRHEIQANAAMVDVLLESADTLRLLLAGHQGKTDQVPSVEGLVQRIAALATGQAQEVAEPAAHTSSAPLPVAVLAPRSASSKSRMLRIEVGPLERPELADPLRDLFKEIPDLGVLEELPDDRAGYRIFQANSEASIDDLLDLFTFHVPKDKVLIHEAAVVPMEETTRAVEVKADEGGSAFGFFNGAPGAPEQPVVVTEPVATVGKPSAKAEAAMAKPAASQTQMEATTIRVAISKVDQLINLVGELVITQAMLAQNSRVLDSRVHQQLLAGLADLDRNTRDLQESVMSIRMIPMSVVFSRFPRMLRDLASKLGKQVDFVTHGEATELDKGLVEKITDPLTHLVRNSCDHGIESPEDRLARGKPERGTITLSASHQGGSILIEVRDDGRGLSRDKILKKARERGLDVSEQMSDAEVWQLIFAPGFSTAETVTDVSGRGVGMDVVKKNIAAMNGTVEIDSAEGYGMRVSVRLPLTLAIMDGMSVSVGEEVYILPLSAVVESFQPDPKAVNAIGQDAQLVKVRNEYIPVIGLERVFQVPRFDLDKSSNIMVIVEAEGSRVALLVDELLGQHQVVVKNLETNYRKVPNVSGATILGDGKVALILDVAALVRRSRH